MGTCRQWCTCTRYLLSCRARIWIFWVPRSTRRPQRALRSAKSIPSPKSRLKIRQRMPQLQAPRHPPRLEHFCHQPGPNANAPQQRCLTTDRKACCRSCTSRRPALSAPSSAPGSGATRAVPPSITGTMHPCRPHLSRCRPRLPQIPRRRRGSRQRGDAERAVAARPLLCAAANFLGPSRQRTREQVRLKDGRSALPESTDLHRQ